MFSPKNPKNIFKVKLRKIFEKFIFYITQKRIKIFKKFQRIRVQQDKSKETVKNYEKSLINKNFYYLNILGKIFLLQNFH